MTGAAGDAAPLLRVLTAHTTAEEVAAIVAVLAASRTPAAPGRAPVGEWSAPRRKLTPVPAHGPGGWRASGLPR